MTPFQIPDHQRISRQWRKERVLMLSTKVFRVLSLVLGILLVALIFSPSSFQVIGAILILAGLGWVISIGVLIGRYCQQPSSLALAKRADHMIGLPDNLLSLSETAPAERDAKWHEATLQHTRTKIAAFNIDSAWPLKAPRSAILSIVAAVFLALALGGVGWMKFTEEHRRLAAEAAARDARIAAAEDVLKDWEKFVELTDDAELKKLFTDAAKLREAIADKDPMAAMLEMNRVEDSMAAMQESIDQNSLSPQAGRIAEAMEALEGAGAMSAAMRNQNFEAASEEARKLAEKLARERDKSSSLRRDAAVTEMLANESKTASQRGNQSLSKTLSDMSNAAKQANSGNVSNENLGPPMKGLQGELSQEAARKMRGRAVSLSKEQIEALRRRLRGEDDDKDRLLLPSLCKSCLGTTAGNKAGTGSGGPPQGEKTDLAQSGNQTSLTGTMGEGESEIRTTSAASGTGGKTASGQKAAFSDYAELSRQAVADENLPLAHRRVIQTYFERIRPVAETKKP